MTTKKHWIAIHIRHDNGKDDAVIIPVTETENLWGKLSDVRGIVAANIYSTQKAAAHTVLQWRAIFKANGSYYWSTMADGSPAPF